MPPRQTNLMTEVIQPTAPSPLGVLSLLSRYWHGFQERRRRHNLRVMLSNLSERELKDIGVPSDEIAYIAARREIDRLRDNTPYRWVTPRDAK